MKRFSKELILFFNSNLIFFHRLKSFKSPHHFRHSVVVWRHFPNFFLCVDSATSMGKLVFVLTLYEGNMGLFWCWWTFLSNLNFTLTLFVLGNSQWCIFIHRSLVYVTMRYSVMPSLARPRSWIFCTLPQFLAVLVFYLVHLMCPTHSHYTSVVRCTNFHI